MIQAEGIDTKQFDCEGCNIPSPSPAPPGPVPDETPVTPPPVTPPEDGGSGTVTEILGCMTYDNATSTCSQCVQYANLAPGGSECSCDFKYKLTPETAQDGSTSYLIDNYLSWAADVPQDGSSFNCSDILDLAVVD